MHLNFSKCYFHSLRSFKNLERNGFFMWQIHRNRYKLYLPFEKEGEGGEKER